MTTLDKYLKYETSYINGRSTNSTNTWRIYTWQEIAIPIRKKIKKNEYKGEYPIVKKISFDSGEIALREERKTRTDLYLAPPRTLIISKINLHQGAVAINNLGWIACTTHYDVYKVNEKIVDMKFLWYYLRSPVFRRKIYDDLKYRGIKKEANYKYLKNIKLELPPIEEQHKIVYVLDTIKYAIEVQDRLLDTLNELKRALMNRLFTKGLDPNQPTKRTEIGEIPAHWKLVKLGEIAKTASGGTPSRKEPHYWGGDIPWVKSSELHDDIIYDTEEKITEEGLKNSSAKIFPKGTLLIAMYGHGQTAGRTGILGINAATNQAVCAIIPKNNEFIPEYMMYYIIFSRKRLLKEKYGGPQPNLSQNIIKNFKVALPPNLEEQKQIVYIIRPVDAKIKLIKKKKTLLQELFNVMLHKLMTGQIRVSKLEEVCPGRMLTGV